VGHHSAGISQSIWSYLMRIVWGQGFENDPIEASRLDGASETRIFVRIGLPLVTTGLTTLGLLSFVGAWNNFFWPLIVISDERLYPLTLGLAVWNSAGTVTGCNSLYTVISRGALISILPLVLAFIFFGRYWRSGLTVGATKG
jgi:multiple sugar transport system permease protein